MQGKEKKKGFSICNLQKLGILFANDLGRQRRTVVHLKGEGGQITRQTETGANAKSILISIPQSLMYALQT